MMILIINFNMNIWKDMILNYHSNVCVVEVGEKPDITICETLSFSSCNHFFHPIICVSPPPSTTVSHTPSFIS